MLTVFAALQMEYGVLQPEQLEPLMAGLAAGDQEALGQLYHRTRTAVYGLAVSILRHGHDAEDVTQDTFVRAWEKAEQYRPQLEAYSRALERVLERPVVRRELYFLRAGTSIAL